jgi:ADP-ribose pyrophosphatase YjhB (NUDIX family)
MLLLLTIVVILVYRTPNLRSKTLSPVHAVDSSHPFIDSSLYAQIREVIPTVCVDLLITGPNGSYLLVLRKQSPAKDRWWLPGGRILKGEPLKDAALRKGREEVGTTLKIGEVISVEESIFHSETPYVHTVNVVFHMVYDGIQKIKINQNLKGYRWSKKIESDMHPCVSNPLKKLGFTI